MNVFLLIFGYLTMATVTIVLLRYIDDEFREDEEGRLLGVAIFLSAIWPLTLIGYTTREVLNAPGTLCRYREGRRERNHQNELDDARRQTVLAQEKAKQVKAEKEALEALGIPTYGFDLK